jgi:RNA polymerase sigma factor (sigma-70 family)
VEQVQFFELDRQFRSPIFRYVLKRIHCEQDALEITQDLLFKIYQVLPSYDPARPLEFWLWTVVKNGLIDWIRESRRRPLITEQPDSEGTARDHDKWRCPLPDAEDLLSLKQAHDQCDRWLSSLTPKQEVIMRLLFTEHLTYQEIADRLEITLASVKCVIHRATTKELRFIEGFLTDRVNT